MDQNAFIAAIIGATLGSSFLTAWINGRFAKNNTNADTEKKEAEADHIIGQAYGALLKDLRTRIGELQKEVFLLKKDHKECMDKNKSLLVRIEKIEKIEKNK